MPNFVGILVVPFGLGWRPMWVESLNERHHVLDLILAGGATHVLTQPLRVEWKFKRGVREHTPDFLVRDSHGNSILVDVTRRTVLEDPAALSVFVLTAATAASMGWHYELRVELPPQRTRNLRYVWTHRTGPVPDDWTQGLSTLEWPAAMGVVVEHLGAGPIGQGRLRRLVEERELFVDLNRPWTRELAVHRSAPEEDTPWIVPI